MLRRSLRHCRAIAEIGCFVAAQFCLASTLHAELVIGVNPSTPSSIQVFNLSAVFYSFGDPGQELADKSLTINGDEIDLYVLMRDLHAPGVFFPQVITPGGASFNNVGPLAAGTYQVNAEMWFERPSPFPGFPPRPPTLFATGELTFEVLPAPTSGVLGDYNGDGTVNAADYTVWQNFRGKSGPNLPADGTGPEGTPDGVVDLLDYDFWKSHFSESASTASASHSESVPEPTAWAFLCVAFLLVGAGLRMPRG